MGYKTRSNYALSGKISQEEFDRIFKKDDKEKCNIADTKDKHCSDPLFCYNCQRENSKDVDLLGRIKK